MQNVIVVLIGVFAFGYLGWQIYKIITRKPGSDNMCGGCTGCSLKENTDCSVKTKPKSEAEKQPK